MDDFKRNLEEPNTTKGSMASIGLLVWDFAKVVVIALAIIIPIRYFFFQPFIVSGSSMEPNFHNGQYLIIDEVSYRFREPVRGEVLVVKYPKNPKEFFIKRVVGLPGEKVKIDNGRITIYNEQHSDGMILNEPYLTNQGLTYPHNTAIIGGRKIVELDNDEYFVMGDNRLASSDSRDWGILTRDGIIGKVFLRALPVTDFQFFTESPEFTFN